MKVWLVKFQREAWESLNDSTRAVEYFGLRICGSGQLRMNSQLWLTRNHHWRETFVMLVIGMIDADQLELRN